MLGMLVIGCVNLWRRLGNLWRRLLRRRVDYVRFELSGALPEFAPPPAWWQRRLLHAQPASSLSTLRRQFARVAADPQAQGVLLWIGGLEGGWATVQSLRDEIGALREQGKRVVAYLIGPDLLSYYAACAADQILMPPTATLTIAGLRTEVRFLKDTLAKFGISAEVEAVSPYKSAGDTFTRADISPEHREQLERLLDGRFALLLEAIARGRGTSTGQARALIDQGLLSGAAAQASGLIDGLCYEDELEERLRVGERKAEIRRWKEARKALRLPLARYQRQRIGVVTVEGTIAAGSSRRLPLPIPLIGEQQAGADSITQALRQAERNRRIAAVLLYINSPGGDAFASDLIWREVLRVRRQKPVVVAMGDLAASGGYYIAAPASAIVAQPGTLTGSIGVVMLRPILSGLLTQAGINTVVLSRGARSGLLSLSEAPTPDERAALRELLFSTYADFKQRVCEGRNIAEAQLEPIAGGRVWMGAEARALGLVDQLGGMPAALLRAQELAGMPQDRSAPLLWLRGGREQTPPQPFPAPAATDALHELAQLLRTRIWALLPLDGL